MNELRRGLDGSDLDILAQANLLIESLESQSSLEIVLTEWWNSIVRDREQVSARTPPSKHPLPSAPSLQSDLAPGWDAAILHACRNDSEKERDSCLQAAAYILVARLLARLVAPLPSNHVAIQTAFLITSRGPHYYLQEFIRAFCSEVSTSEYLFSDWIESLRMAVPIELESYLPDRKVYGWSFKYISQWKEQKNPFTVWNRGPGYNSPLSDMPWALLILSRLDVVTWIHVLESLPDPAIVEHYLFVTSPKEIWGYLPQLILLAQPAFDGDGKWNHNTVALIIAGHILTSARRQMENSPMVRRIRDIEANPAKHDVSFETTEIGVKTWLRGAYEALLSRSDGCPIAIGLLAETAREALHDRPGKDEFSLANVAVETLSEVLTAVGVSPDAPEQVWRSLNSVCKTVKGISTVRTPRKTMHGGEEELRNGLDGLPWLNAATYLLESHAPSPKRSKYVEQWGNWLKELLRGQDPLLTNLSLDGSAGRFEHRIIQRCGYIVSLLPDPWNYWMQVWNSLESDRRSFEYRDRREFSGGGIGSGLLVHIGLQALVRLRWRIAGEQRHDSVDGTTSEPTQVVDSWFRAIFDAALRLQYISDPFDRLLEIATTFAYTPEIFGTRLAVVLPRYLELISNDPRTVMRSALLLIQNGVAPEACQKIFFDAGVELVDSIRHCQEWTLATGMNDEFPLKATELLATLNTVPNSPLSEVDY